VVAVDVSSPPQVTAWPRPMMLRLLHDRSMDRSTGTVATTSSTTTPTIVLRLPADDPVVVSPMLVSLVLSPVQDVPVPAPRVEMLLHDRSTPSWAGTSTTM